MDEDYRTLQSDLCFYPSTIENNNNSSGKDKHPMSSERGARLAARTICVDINYEDGEAPHAITEPEIITPATSPVSEATDTTSSATNTSSTASKNSSSSQDTVIVSASKPEQQQHKNEVIFKNLFGATKNALFRTAQRAQGIRDGHDKKSGKVKEEGVKSPTEKKRDFSMLIPGRIRSQSSQQQQQQQSAATLQLASPVTPATTPDTSISEASQTKMIKSPSGASLSKDGKKLPGTVQCLIKEPAPAANGDDKHDRAHSSLLRFFESPVFNIHFAIHYLFYSKEPGVLSFIVNKIFSFPDHEVDLYIPQLILMYIQMDQLTDVLDPYLTYRCRRSADFSLKCLWMLEAYNCNIDALMSSSSSAKKSNLALFRELNPKRERKHGVRGLDFPSPIRKTHHRSQSDASGMLNNLHKLAHVPSKLCLGDLNSGRAFDNGCVCFESVRGTVNDLLGQQTVCSCGAPKLTPQKEFMRALIDIGKTLTALQSKIEKTSRLRVLLNLINKNLPARVWLPLFSEIPHHVVRIAEEKTAVLNSKDKAPYIIYVEIVEVDDIYSSPVIPKMMPTLRHTKSEEYLDVNTGDGQEAAATATARSHRGIDISIGGPDDDVWSQDDDDITTQYLKMHKLSERDAVSQHSLDSVDSKESGELAILSFYASDPLIEFCFSGLPTVFNIADVRVRHCANLSDENKKPFQNDPEDPSAAALKVSFILT